MVSNEQKIHKQYKAGSDSGQALISRYFGMEHPFTIKHLNEYIKDTFTVIEIGCGPGYYALQYSDKCKEYVGLDSVPENIAILNNTIKLYKLKNVKAYIGDETHLREYQDRFDVVLCLTPLYHLPPEKREFIFAECSRICKPGGVAAFSYINKVGLYVGACINARNNYPSKEKNENVLKLSIDDKKPELIYYTMPEEIEQLAKNHGFSKIKNLGTDFCTMMNSLEALREKRFDVLYPLLDEMASYESCTGMSTHALLICRKNSDI